MPIKYSCFISYPHSDKSELWESIVTQVKEMLENYIGASMREQVYFDKDRLKPGYSLDESLVKAICESVCMIVAYGPLYHTSNYCLQEFMAMEKIEERRAQILGQEYFREH